MPDATLLSARIVKSAACTPAILEDGLLAAFGWLRRQGAQVVNVSATVKSVARPRGIAAGRCSSPVRWSWPRSATAGSSRAPRSPPRSPACSASGRSSRARPPRCGRSRRAARWSISWRRRRASRSSRPGAVSLSSVETAITDPGTSFAAPLVTAAAAMVWATHRDWTAAEVASALVRSATPLGKRAEPQLGLRPAGCEPRAALPDSPDSHEPNDWVAAALAQRPLRPGSVVVASLGWAGDTVDAYVVDMPAGTTGRAVLRSGGQGLTMRVLSGARPTPSSGPWPARARTRPPGRPARRPLAAGRRPQRRGKGPTCLRSRGLRHLNRGSGAASAAARPRADHQVTAPPSSTTLPIR